jgi:hypothetical protein
MTLVGIMPKRFTKLGSDLWLVRKVDPADPVSGQQFFRFQARMKPGVTLRQVEADLTPIAHELAELYPKTIRPNSTSARRVGSIVWCGSSGQRYIRSQPRSDCSC